MKPFNLPPLRQELAIYPAPSAADGSRTWTLHDPSANRFYQLNWQAFEILSRWDLGRSDLVVGALARETTLTVTHEDIAHIALFLEQSYLVETKGSIRALAGLRAMRVSWMMTLLKNYLFFRVPLLKPQKVLDAFASRVTFMYSQWFLTLALAAAVLALYVISRQWDVFRHSLAIYRTWEGIAATAVAVSIAKTAHEFGHAVTAHRYGCKIPAMGIVFVVLFPMLYTDTNEVWKLQDRHKRLAVGAAGMATELLLAVAATWAWVFLPDGVLRSGAFVLATTSWVMTLLLNASPFLRYDGYFILSDFLGIANLHARSFAFGRWWLREILFGFDDPPPEPMPDAYRKFLIVFSYVVWAYRFFIFLGIAILVYRYFFKMLGIILFSVEMWWFILQPVYREVRTWVDLRFRMKLNYTIFRTACATLAFIIVFLIPWSGRITAPAMMSAAREQGFYAAYPSEVVEEPAQGRGRVRAGDVLVVLRSQELEYKVRQARVSESQSRWDLEHQPFNEEALAVGEVLRHRFEETKANLDGLEKEWLKLMMRAPFDGNILTRNDEIRPGLFIPAREQLYVLVDPAENKVDAFVNGSELQRIAIGNKATFIPDGAGFGTFTCRVAAIDKVNLAALEEPSLASPYSGPIPAQADPKGLIRPLQPVFRVRLASCDPPGVPALRLKGVAGIKAKRRSAMAGFLQRIYDVILRESNF